MQLGTWVGALAILCGIVTEAGADDAAGDFNSYSSSIVVIEGDQGRGTGFLVQLKDGPALVTNAHVLSGQSRFTAKALGGAAIATESFAVADDRDLVRIHNKAIDGGLEIVDNVESNVNIGDDVVVLGNSLGAGVVTQLKGKVVGIGPDLVEIDAAIVPGNSGSPVIHVKTGRVIGIATYATIRKRKADGFGKDSPFYNVERRFAYRLDNVPGWKEMPWNLFAREGLMIDDLSHETDCFAALIDNLGNDKVAFNFAVYQDRDNPLRSSISDLQDQLQKPSMKPSYYLDALRTFLWFTADACTKDVASIRPEQFSSYHRKKMEEILDDRKYLADYFQYLNDRVDRIYQRMKDR